METTFLIIVGVLIILAITDLVVGVSNDAVNFLNSAIGAKVASRRVIMFVAAAGIFIGATFSSGMMEIARKGIFNPEFFMFSDIMMIFLAVMLADIILLDLFNSLGLPTSTTVSIVFELLGAAVILALMKTIDSSSPITEVSQYINSSKAIAIVTGILLSVFIAFTVGALVQFLSRWLFSFHFEKRIKYFGAIWTGLALTALTYFLLLKGLKGSSFATDEFVAWVKEYNWLILVVSFVFWAMLMQLAVSLFKWNILKFVVLFGTFALAMAFAGNDLVNFVGVPLAGLESFIHWKSSGIAPDELSMDVLKYPVRANTWFLLAAGAIMAATLYLSRKARKVTDTQVNLSRQDESDERFSPNILARALVKGTTATAGVVEKLLPTSLKNNIERNFSTTELKNEDDAVAFDMVRAAVNLTVASALIALGTSLKLPLSTTYVSFMVAMGTSLTDKAWGRESAVYRVSGVLNVIGGWFATAIVAFLMAGAFAFVMFQFGFNAGFALMVIVAVLIIRGFINFRKKEKTESGETLKRLERLAKINQEEFVSDVFNSMQQSQKAYADAFEGLIREDAKYLIAGFDDISELKKSFKKAEGQLFKIIRNSSEEQLYHRSLLLKIFGKLQDLFQSTEAILSICKDHIINNHKPPSDEQAAQLREMIKIMKKLTEEAATLNEVPESKEEFEGLMESVLKAQIKGIQKSKYGKKNSSLIFRLVSESRDFSNCMSQLSRHLNKLDEEKI